MKCEHCKKDVKGVFRVEYKLNKFGYWCLNCIRLRNPGIFEGSEPITEVIPKLKELFKNRTKEN